MSNIYDDELDEIEEIQDVEEESEDEVDESDIKESSDEKESSDKKVKSKKKPFYKRWSFRIVAVIILIVLIFNYFFTVVVINGSSMEPNFHDGNIIIAHRHYDIWRFDVVTIASKAAGKVLVKRVIGLPNETIEYKEGNLFVNGEYKPDTYSMGETKDFKITLGTDEYFCMGDNRENSADSREYGTFTSDEIFAKLDYKVNPSK